MPKCRFTAGQLKEAGPERVEKALTKDASLPKEMLGDPEMRGFSFGDSRNRGNLLIGMLLRVQPGLAVGIIGSRELREGMGPGAKLLAQFAVESSPDAALRALESREVYLLPASSSSRYIKYIAHSSVFYPAAARFALDREELCSLENRCGGSLEDYIKRLHSGRLFLRRGDPGVRIHGEMVWGRKGEAHY